MATHFPQELFPEILLRLSVKSLLRFRCVSKSWNSLITSSNFITGHINHNTSNNCNAIVRCYYETRDDSYTLHSDNKNLDKILDIDLPFRNTNLFFYILSCANGVLCLLDSYQRSNAVVLWNPMIRRYLTLPKPSHNLTGQQRLETALGFGFDALNKDYKVVRIYNLEGKPAMDIFRLSTCCWSNVDSTSSVPSLRPDCDGGTYLNGVLHWFTYDLQLIAGLDLGTETFRELALAKGLESGDIPPYDISIEVWREQLSIFEMDRSRQTCCLWVMKEYGIRDSWVKQFKIGGFGPLTGIRTDGGLLLWNWRSRRESYVVGYEPETQETKSDIVQFKDPLFRLQIMPYIESLVLLNEGEDTNGQPVIETEDY